MTTLTSIVMTTLTTKSIKDYLPFYMGAWVTIKDCTPYLIVQGLEDGRYLLSADILHFILTDQCILETIVLRNLSDMTEEEAIWCLNEVFLNQECRYPKSHYRFDFVGEKKANPRIRINNDWFDHTLTFGNTRGSVWSVDTPAQNVKIPASLFAFLLSKQFDLFGLIESGLAIDKQTLKQS